MFLPQTIEYASNLNADSTERLIYDIMIHNAVGNENALSKNRMRSLLADSGHNCSKQSIASHISASRKYPHFFGIKRFGGIYIIDNERDARLTLDYYTEQMNGIMMNRNYLRNLCRRYGFNL